MLYAQMVVIKFKESVIVYSKGSLDYINSINSGSFLLPHLVRKWIFIRLCPFLELEKYKEP